MASIDLITSQEWKDRYEVADTDTARDTALADAITDASRVIMDYCRREFAPASSGTRRFELQWHPEYGWWVDFDQYATPCDCRTVTVVTADPDVSAITVITGNWKLLPIGGDRGDGTVAGQVYTELQLSSYLAIIPSSVFKFGSIDIDVTGTWGFATVPESVKRACAITVRDWLRSGGVADNSYWQEARESQPIAPASWGIPPAALRDLNAWLKNGGAGGV